MELGDHYIDYNNPDADQERVFNYYLQASNLNFAPAKLRLAECYYAGVGVEKDEEYARTLAEGLAANGDDDAANFLADYFPQ